MSSPAYQKCHQKMRTLLFQTSYSRDWIRQKEGPCSLHTTQLQLFLANKWGKTVVSWLSSFWVVEITLRMTRRGDSPRREGLDLPWKGRDKEGKHDPQIYSFPGNSELCCGLGSLSSDPPLLWSTPFDKIVDLTALLKAHRRASG